MPYSPQDNLRGLKRVCESVKNGEQKLLVTLDKLMDIDKIRDNETVYNKLSALWADCAATFKKIGITEGDIDSFDEWSESEHEIEMLQYQLTEILREHSRHGKAVMAAIKSAAPGP